MDYFGRLYETWLCSGVLGILMAIVWLLYPVAFVTLYHPGDAIGFQAWLQGAVIPQYLTHQQLTAGVGETLVAIGILFVFHLVVVTLIFRRSQLFVHLWPAAVVLVGGIANGIWWLSTGYWDPIGAVAGLSPAVVSFVAQAVCEHLGKRFIFGPMAGRA